MDFTTLAIVKKLVGDTAFIQGALKGDNGRNPELTAKDGWIKWRLVGDTQWNNLIELTELKSDVEKIIPELSVENGYLRWRLQGEDAWNDLYDLKELKVEIGAQTKLVIQGSWL